MISLPIRKILSISLFTLGIGGVVLFGGNELSKVKVSDGLGEVKLLAKSNSGSYTYPWYRLFSELESGGKAKTEKFQKAFSFLKEDLSVEDERTGNFRDFSQNLINKGVENLRKACEESKVENYSSWLHTDQSLMDDVKSFCSIRIRHALSSDKLFKFSGDTFDSTEKQNWTTKLTSLRQGKNTEEQVDSKLSAIRDTQAFDDDDSENITSLFNWCKESLEDYYVSDSDQKITIIKKYCSKST